jgi:hypothetical protein
MDTSGYHYNDVLTATSAIYISSIEYDAPEYALSVLTNIPEKLLSRFNI